MKYLVTGGYGFIGSNYIVRLLGHNPDAQILNVDALTYAGNPKNLESVKDNPRYAFEHMDITCSCIGEIFNRFKPDIVVHFAAETHVDRSISGSHVFVNTNVLGTQALLASALHSGVKKFIHIGTDEVYGQIPAPNSSIETDVLDPRSPYSASKAAADLLALSYYTTHGLPVIVTRCCNNYGLQQYPEKLIPLFVTNLLEGKNVPIYGDGRQVREWIHTADHNRAIDYIIEHGSVGEIYNIGSGVEKENIDITMFILYHYSLDENQIDWVEDRKGHDQRYSIDCTKLRDLGWEPIVDFEEGLKDTIRWYEQNEDWWRPLKDE